MSLPLLVVVTGMPSSGKTTLAEGLAPRLRLPLIAKDAIKESLYETLGADDVASSSRVGGAAYGLIFALADGMLASGVSMMVEANFFRGQEPEFEQLAPHRSIQLHCAAPLPILLDRYAQRARHAGHHDGEKIKELPGRFASGAHSPLILDGELVRLDTTYPVELDSLVNRIRAMS